ncbi:MAG: Ig-like domain-containing protein [Chthoniobacteraceae bacterium]
MSFLPIARLRCLFTALALCTAGARALPPGFIERDFGSSWSEPLGLVFDPSVPDRAFVWERQGRVWIVENGVKHPLPVVDLSDEVGGWRDFGLIGFALDPNFAQNGFIYLYYCVDRHHLIHAGTPAYDPQANNYFSATIGRITRYTARASDGFRSVDPASRRVLVGESIATGFPVLFQSHGPGQLVFGRDGTLLASCGDGASYEVLDDGGEVGSYAAQGLADGIIRSKENVGSFRSQLVDSLCGKIVRIDPATGDGIASNPFYTAANPRSARSRVWTLGLRNPYRICLKPGTGSTNPTDANPGTIALGDVGWEARESHHIIDGPGKNCGWPLYEGFSNELLYQASDAVNRDAPNPLGGFFRFRDLLIRATLGTPSWPNPLNPALQVPSSIPRFMHHRPVLDIGRDEALPGPVRTGIFSGNTATTIPVGAPGSPVAGPQFIGECATGGVFYTGTDFPASYAGTYFFADYAANWIRNLTLDANNKPTLVRNFLPAASGPVFITTHPTRGSLYYVGLAANIVRQVVYTASDNRPPTASASADATIGPSPLTIHFTSNAADPDGDPLTYLWSFGDGTTSTLANPTKTFAIGGAARFDVTLTVKDPFDATTQATLAVFVNHTLPQLEIVSPVDGGKYALNATNSYALLRRVVESPGHPTTTRWQVFLHHDAHEHPEPPIDAASTTAVISPNHTAGSTFYYRITATVTDDLGASVTREVRLHPNTTNIAPQIAWAASPLSRIAGTGLLVVDAAATISDADSLQFDFGGLTVQSAGALSGDTLGILPQGDGAAQVNLSGADVRYEGYVVGTLAGGTAGQPLVITFNSVATPAAARAILRRVGAAFQGNGTRTLTATINDGDGGVTQSSGLVINVTGTPNQPPNVTLTSPAEDATFTLPATVSLTASASDTDGGVARVEFFAGASLLGTDTSAPFAIQWPSAPAGSHTLFARATDDRGATRDSAPVHVTMNSDTTLPPVWHAADIGVVNIAGQASYSDGTYTLDASGAGVSALKDEFHFLSQPWIGDGEIIARLPTLSGPVAKSFGGVMFREKPGGTSRFALLELTVGQGALFRWRTQPGQTFAQQVNTMIAAPRWLRLVRHGLRCTAYTSTDGAQWQQLGTASLPMARSLFVGLVASSGADGQAASAVFDNVVVRALPSPSAPTVAVSSPAEGATFSTPVVIAIDARASDPDGGIARVELFNGAKKLAIDARAPFRFSWPGVAAGSYSLTARAFDFSGLQTTSTPIAVTVSTVPGALPAPWVSRDIGPTAQGGTASESVGVFTLTTVGPGLGAPSDQGRVVFRPWSGDGTIIARLASLAETAPAAHAGVMFRESLSASARHAAVVITCEQGALRKSRAEPAASTATSARPGVAAPQWVKLVRRGTNFTSYISVDGVAWSSLGVRAVPMGAACYVALIAGAADPDEATTAIFDHVSVKRP